MAPQLRPRRGELERQRLPAPVPPDDPAPAFAGLDRAEIRVTPSEFERRVVTQRCRDPRRQHPGEVDTARARNDGRRPRKRHAGFSNLDPDGSGAASEKRAETTQPRLA